MLHICAKMNNYRVTEKLFRAVLFAELRSKFSEDEELTTEAVI